MWIHKHGSSVHLTTSATHTHISGSFLHLVVHVVHISILLQGVTLILLRKLYFLKLALTVVFSFLVQIHHHYITDCGCLAVEGEVHRVTVSTVRHPQLTIARRPIREPSLRTSVMKENRHPCKTDQYTGSVCVCVSQ